MQKFGSLPAQSQRVAAKCKVATPKRFGLSGLITGAITAAVILAANVIPQGPLLGQTGGTPADGLHFEYWWGFYRGWPFHYQEIELHLVKVRHAGSPEFPVPTRNGREVPFEELEWARYLPLFNPWVSVGIWLTVNVVLGLILVLGSAAACQFIVRRAVQRRSKGEGSPSQQ